jgi:Uma2 family endonuclease
MTTLLTSAERSYRFDVRQFHRMMAAGIFDDQKVELVAGKIYPMTDLPPHVFAVGRLHEALRAFLRRDHWSIREEKPILIGRYWAPKPDIAVLRGDDTVYATRQPRPRDVALLIEVADTTYHRNRGRKWRRYAAAGIPIFVIVRLKSADTVVEVWTGPAGRGKAARYTDVVCHAARAGESVPIVLDDIPHGQVAVVDLIPR